ncbi:MAG TPA: hypothetical protein VJH03_01630 [Blastocatellia bacterium]|nr:hypothetical protein [Blastocatellia bacterium]
MDRANNQAGYTVLEVLLAATLTVGLFGVVFSIVNRNQDVFVKESNVTEMNQNVRVAIDLLTRDIQSAGMGLPRASGSFAAIYYTDGASNSSDSLLILNGDPYAPTADVTDRAAGSAEFSCMLPPDVTATGNGANVEFTYLGGKGQPAPIYKSFATDPRYYLVYDDNRAMVMALSRDGMLTGPAGNQRLSLQHNPTSFSNPPTVFGTAMDAGEPDYASAKLAVLGSMVAYRVNDQTRELERTEDLTNWYSVARGVTSLQVRYRVVSRDESGNIVETMTSMPTDRRSVRSVEVTISSETPDVLPSSRGYRQAVQRFETAPRNFNLLNNTNLSSNLN